MTGPSVPVLDDVSLVIAGTGIIRARYSISQNGTLVYGTGGPVAGQVGAGQQLVVVDLEPQSDNVLALRSVPQVPAGVYAGDYGP